MNAYLLLSLERPAGMVGVPRFHQDYTYLLTREAQDAGLGMLDITYRQPELDNKDPLIIFDGEGRIRHQWPDGYFPGPHEIWKVCSTLLQSA